MDHLAIGATRRPGSRLPSRAEVRVALDDELTVTPYFAAVALGQAEAVVRRAIASGELPSVRFGRNIRVPTAALRRLLELD